jgi:hypothetical protein
MTDDLEIREQLARYADENTSLDDLEHALIEGTWSEDEEQTPLAADALRLVSELRHGDWTEDELRERLGAMAKTYRFDQAPLASQSESAARTIVEDRALAGAGR